MVPARGDRMDETEGGFKITEERKEKKARSGTMAGGVSGTVGRKAGKMNRNRSGGRRILGADPGRGNISWRCCGPGRLNFD